ncbi:ABC transporter permease [Clavibacter californiensis]|jgi:simple sugar transport system permease protein|uniref:ABC transporter permease n=1 Tax=Clavibacter californiensis TaxID=1401995 RepID=A0ABX9NB93_9MICO|nr:ABC transporter permease [Clavibacter californiensis]RII90182.1 ABC transporter permease [Clavibacter californiensis]RII94780.1 ABC transporter permease [Clavibacter californiensis]UKF80815.1 ABC transporter permease [Clavibacter californiensis]
MSTDTRTNRPSLLTGLVRRQWFGGAVAILLLLLVNVAKDPGYLAISTSPSTGYFVGNLIDIARAAAPILMIAVGMCLVIATGGIDLSVGSIMVVAGAVSMEFLNAAGAPDSLGAAAGALGLALLISAVLGAINGILVSVVGLQPFISTLVVMLAGRGLAKVITGGQNTAATNEPFRWLANGYVFGLPVVFLLAIAIVIAVGLLVRRSALGLMLEAIGMDAKAARLAGLNRRALLLTAYISSGILAGVAGVFATASVMTVDTSRTGYQLELDAILAVVIGGTSLAGGKFNIAGAAVGAILIATLDKTVVFLGVSSSATPAFKAIVIVALCLLQSERVRSAFSHRREARRRAPQKESIPA